MIKQNQSLYRPFPGQQITLKHHDHLTDNKCSCHICQDKKQKLNPQISIDQKYQKLKSQKSKMISLKSVNLSNSKQLSNSLSKQISKQLSKQYEIQQFEWYLNKLAYSCKTLPNFPILDTMLIQKGQLSFYIFYQHNKCKIHYNSLFKQQQKQQRYQKFQKSQKQDKMNASQKVSQFIAYNMNLIKQKILQRKVLNDIQYQKNKYKQQHPLFEWSQLDHDSQKLIKEFEKKIKFIDQVLNRVSIIKQEQKYNNEFYSLTRSQQYRIKQSMIPTIQEQQSQKVLSKYQFCNLFDKTRIKVCQFQNISYIQLFPIMYGEQQQSYVKQIKYFRSNQSSKPLFKQAQSYVLAWIQKNQTLQKMQHQFINEYFYSKQQNIRKLTQFPHTSIKRLNQQAEQQYLMYQSYKILLHLQIQTNIQISQCLLQYITANNGSLFYLKSIKYIKYTEKPMVEIKQNQLPKFKHIQKQDYIMNLKQQMNKLFYKVQYQYQRLNKDWQNFQNKTINDRKESDSVFKQVRGIQSANLQSGSCTIKNDEKQKLNIKQLTKQQYLSGQWAKNISQDHNQINLHKILKSNNLKYKQQMLGLNNTFKVNSTKLSNISKPLAQSKVSKATHRQK